MKISSVPTRPTITWMSAISFRTTVRTEVMYVSPCSLFLSTRSVISGGIRTRDALRSQVSTKSENAHLGVDLGGILGMRGHCSKSQEEGDELHGALMEEPRMFEEAKAANGSSSVCL